MILVIHAKNFITLLFNDVCVQCFNMPTAMLKFDVSLRQVFVVKQKSWQSIKFEHTKTKTQVKPILLLTRFNLKTVQLDLICTSIYMFVTSLFYRR